MRKKKNHKAGGTNETTIFTNYMEARTETVQSAVTGKTKGKDVKLLSTVKPAFNTLAWRLAFALESILRCTKKR